MGINSFKELKVWQKAMLICTNVYLLSKNLPQSELFGLTSQLRRSAVSIPSNIAEGFCRKSTKDYVRFLRIAYGSLAELETQIILCENLHFIEENNIVMLEIDELKKMINKLMSVLSAHNY